MGFALSGLFGVPTAASAEQTEEFRVEITRNGNQATLRAYSSAVATTAGHASKAQQADSPSTVHNRSSRARSFAEPTPQPICTNEIGGIDFLLATPPPVHIVDPYLVVQVCKLDGVLTDGGGVFWADRNPPVAAAAGGGAAAPEPVLVPAVTDVDIRRYVQDFLIPDLTIRQNPDGPTLTGVETWFWVEGWDGAPVSETVDVLGVPVLVELRLTSVEWDFGDGTIQAATDLGHAYPNEAGMTHVYTRRSTRTAEDAAFTATSTITIEVAASIGGSPLVPLQPFEQTEAVPVVVREAQALLE